MGWYLVLLEAIQEGGLAAPWMPSKVDLIWYCFKGCICEIESHFWHEYLLGVCCHMVDDMKRTGIPSSHPSCIWFSALMDDQHGRKGSSILMSNIGEERRDHTCYQEWDSWSFFKPRSNVIMKSSKEEFFGSFMNQEDVLGGQLGQGRKKREL